MPAEVVVSFSTPTASVVTGGGDAVFSAFTAVVGASGAAPSFESSTAVVTSLSGNDATVDVQFAKHTATADVDVGKAYSVSATFEGNTAVVQAPDVIEPAFEALTVSATVLSGRVATVAGAFAPLEPSITYTAQNLATGTGTFAYNTAEVVSSQASPATVAPSFANTYAAVLSYSGRVAEVEATFAENTAAVVSAPQAIGTVSATFERQYAAVFSEPTLAATFRTWTMNTRNLNITEYTNFDFNSYAVFNGSVYAAGAAGIMKLTGADDNGTDISAVARLGAVGDRKNNQLSRIPEVVIAAASASPITVTITQEDGTSYSYNTQYSGVATLRQHRVTPGKGLRSTRYKVQFSNNNGDSFELGPVMVNTVPVNRRLGG